MTQMNIRIDERLKAQGDSAFEAIGWTPSQAARVFWQFAADHKHNPHQLKKECERLAGVSQQDHSSQLEKISKGWHIVSDAMAKLGIDMSQTEQTMSDKELLHEAMIERYTERGLL